MAPVFAALQRTPGIQPLLLATGQHREQLLPVLELFGIPIAANLDVMTEQQRLPELAASIIPSAARLIVGLGADYVLVHGDTLSTFAVAWAAFLQGVPLGHVEAGLRTRNLAEPFPEEANRRLTDCLSDLDLAPTPTSLANLLEEGKARDQIIVTGQTGVDAIRLGARLGRLPDSIPEQRPLVTVTMHRRENWDLLGSLAVGLARVSQSHPNFHFVYPVHLNPRVRAAVFPVLSGLPNFQLLEPLGYGEMAALLRRSVLLVTDSGGLQEEGAALGVPVAVLRNVTERPEGLATGALKLLGTDPHRVTALLDELLGNAPALAAMARARNPYGDGNASGRVAAAVAWRLGMAPRPDDWSGASQGQEETELVGSLGAAGTESPAGA